MNKNSEGAMTAEIAAALRQNHGVVSFLRVSDIKGNKHDFAFKRIDRNDIDLSTKEVSNSATRALELQMCATCVHGDIKLIQVDDEIYRAIQNKWQTIQKECDSEILNF